MRNALPFPNPWRPMADPVDIEHIGKLQEELGELQAALSRCLIQGIDEAEPVTGVINRDWLQKEIADVYAGLTLLLERFDLFISQERIEQKKFQLRQWYAMLGKDNA